MLYLDRTRLLQLMQAFYTLSGIRMGLLDHDGRELIAYPQKRCSFCDLIRSDPSIEEQCISSDAAAFARSKKSNGSMVYTCHAGLSEVISPVRKDGVILCYIMFGQVLDSATEEQTRKAILNRFSGFGFPEDSLRSAVMQINHVTYRQITASAVILDSLVSYVLSNKLAALEKEHFIESLNTYVEAHMGEPIAVEDLCRHFGLGRTSLYGTAKRYLSCGLMEYVRRQRLAYAKQLLSSTQISVTEIAMQSGFSDYNYFCRVFRQATGMSPRQYRISSALRPPERANGTTGTAARHGHADG